MPAEYRHAMREIRQFLESDLFERIPTSGPDSAAWKNPGGFTVAVTPTERRDGLKGYVERSDGSLVAATSWLDVGWLEEVLP